VALKLSEGFQKGGKSSEAQEIDTVGGLVQEFSRNGVTKPIYIIEATVDSLDSITKVMENWLINI